MTQNSVAKHHLSHTDSTSPSRIRCVSNFKISAKFLPQISRQASKPFTQGFFLPCKEWLEILSVAKPDQHVEMKLKVSSDFSNFNSLTRLNIFSRFVRILGVLVLFIQEEHRQVLKVFDFYLFSDEEFDKRVEEPDL